MSEQPKRDPAIIDQHALDREIVLQPGMTREAGYREADAKHRHDQAKAALAVVAARLSLAIRRSPDRYHLRERPNQDEIEAAVLLQPEYERANNELIEAKYALDVATADTVWTLDRRKMIERLVDLLALDYYAEREPRPRSSKGRDRADEARARDVRVSLDDSDAFKP